MNAHEATLALLRAELEAAVSDVVQNWGGAFTVTEVSVVLDHAPQELAAGPSPPSSPTPERVELHVKGIDRVLSR